MSQPEINQGMYQATSLEARLVSKWLGEGRATDDEALQAHRHSTLENILGSLVVSESAADNLEAEHLHNVFEQHRPAITTYKCADALSRYLSQDDWRKDDEILYPHQNDAMHAVLDGLLDGRRLGYIVTPTAGGKAYMVAKLTEAFTDAGLRVLVTAHRKTITQQLGNNPSKGIRRFAHNIRSTDVALHYGTFNATHQAPVVVSTYQSMNKFAKTGELGEFDVILADEAHNALGEVTQANLLEFSPDSVKIGLTATPDYGTDKRVADVLPYKYYEYNVRKAIEEGVISPVQVLVYVTGAEIPKLDNQSDFTDRELSKLIELKSRNAAAVQIASNLVEAGRQGYVACVSGEDRAHARLMARLISAVEVNDRRTGLRRKIISRSITGDMPDSEREQLLQDYEKGLIDVLTFVDVLTEGWDSDKSSFGLDLRPTTSIVKKTQTIGRGLRKKPLEFMFVEFRDSSVKNQVSALQVFGEETFNLGRVISPPGLEWESSVRRSYLRGMFDENLWENFLTYDAKLIKDLTLRQKAAEFDRLYQEWNSKLIAEGMPEEQADYMGQPLSFVQAIAKIKRLPGARATYIHQREQYLRKRVAETFVRDEEGYRILKLVPDLTEREAMELEYLQSVIAAGEESEYYDSQVPELVQPTDPKDLSRRIERSNPNIDTTYVNAAYNITRQSLMRVIEALKPREQKIINERAFNHIDRTLDGLGRELGVTRERVRGIEHEALQKIRWGVTSGEPGDGLLSDLSGLIRLEKSNEPNPRLITKVKLRQSVAAAVRLSQQRVRKWETEVEQSKTEFAQREAEAKLTMSKIMTILYSQYLKRVNKGPAITANTLEFNASTIYKLVEAHFGDPQEAAEYDKEIYEEIYSDLSAHLARHGVIATPFQNQYNLNAWLQQVVARAVTKVSYKQWSIPPFPTSSR
jgi:superfamily II DNA or RNA helicase